MKRCYVYIATMLIQEYNAPDRAGNLTIYTNSVFNFDICRFPMQCFTTGQYTTHHIANISYQFLYVLCTVKPMKTRHPINARINR